VAQTPVDEVCDHRAEWRVRSACFQYRSDNRREARSRPFGKSQTCGKDACLRHPAAAAGVAFMPPFGMYVVMALRSAVPGVGVHSSPTAKRSRTSQNDVGATRPMSERPFAVKDPLTTP
jgi:hypothetical protein